MTTSDTEPTAMLWYSVETPSVFREHWLPTDDDARTSEHRRQYRELLRLAEAHGTHVHATPYRRG